MEDAGLAVPDNVGDIADALGEMGSHLMEDYQRGELDLGRFKDEILDFYDLNFAVNDALALAIMSHDDLQYYYYVYMQGLYIFFPNMMEAFNADIDDAKIIPSWTNWPTNSASSPAADRDGVCGLVARGCGPLWESRHRHP